jgi:hypothetical protein
VPAEVAEYFQILVRIFLKRNDRRGLTMPSLLCNRWGGGDPSSYSGPETNHVKVLHVIPRQSKQIQCQRQGHFISRPSHSSFSTFVHFGPVYFKKKISINQ